MGQRRNRGGKILEEEKPYFEVEPMESLHLLYMERRRAIVIHAYVYDFMSIQTLSILCCLARIAGKLLFRIFSPS